jgi:ParB-like chromosome segregation protein Spo0J
MSKPNEFESKHLPLDKLIDCPLNARRIDPDAAELRELGNSLAVRQEVDLIVRPVAGGVYEVLDGKRRVAAARAVGTVEKLWCQVRDPCSDADALKIIIVTQLHRMGLDPLAEAALVAQLLHRCATLEQAAAELGRPAAWVARRAKLSDLDPIWRDGLAAGKFAWATVAHLEHVARLPAEVQREIAAAYAESWNAPDSVTAFGNEIREKYLHTLKAAPWKLDDLALLPTATACSSCPKRSNNQTSLFADQVDAADRCLDAVCWGAKLDRHNASKARQLASKHAKVLVLTHYEDNSQPAPADLPEQAVVMTTRCGLEDCKKSDEGAMPAIDAETGKQTFVKVASWAPKETRAALGMEPEKPAPKTGDTPAPTAADKRLARRLAFRLAQVDRELCDAEPPPLSQLVKLYTVFCESNIDPLDPAGWKDADKLPDDELTDILWQALTRKLCQYSPVRASALPEEAAVEALERLATLDPVEQAAKALTEVPEPKGKAQP